MMRSSTFEMAISPPFRLDLTAWALRRRATNSMDRWEDGHYSRTVVLEDDAFDMVISQIGGGHRPVLQVTLSGPSGADTEAVENAARSLVSKMLGTSVDLRPFYALAEGSDVLRPLAERFLGLKPPRFPTLFEALVNAIACQQVSLDSGIRTLNRFSERFGRRLEGGTGARSFPRPEDLASISEDEIKAVGLSRQKALAIKRIANDGQAIENALAGAEQMSDAEILSYLSTIRGIGRWSAEYVLLRGLGRLDMFPGDDVGARNNLQRLFHLDEKPDYERIKELTSSWRPYQGLVYFHLLLNNLQAKGLV
jgi:DNA-3-methyladenine glycosylase II